MTSQECDLFPYKGMKLFSIVALMLVFPYKGINLLLSLYELINFRELKLVLFYYFNLLFSIMKREIFWKAEALLLQNPFGSLYFMDKVRYFKSWSSDASEIHRFILFLVFIKWEIFESWSFVASEIHRFTLFLVYKVRDIWELKLCGFRDS